MHLHLFCKFYVHSPIMVCATSPLLEGWVHYFRGMKGRLGLSHSLSILCVVPYHCGGQHYPPYRFNPADYVYRGVEHKDFTTISLNGCFD